jgi:transposase-like protein
MTDENRPSNESHMITTTATEDGDMRRRPAPIKRPQHMRDEAVKRHLEGGETVKALCKFYKVSRATMYNWVEAYKAEIVQNVKTQGVAPRDLERIQKQELIAQNEILQTENRKLRDRLVDALHAKAPTHCDCGREIVLCPNGERHCADTLEKFKVRHGYEYGSSRAKEGK